jgi:hypothetical protein
MQTIRNLTEDHAIRQGIIFGAILGLAHIVYSIMNNLMNLQGTAFERLNQSLLIALLLLLILPGLFAKQATAGARAGFTAGLISSLIGILSLWIITFLFMDVIARNTYMILDFQRSRSATMNQFIIEDAMGATVIQLIVSLVLGAVLGFVGGWIGSIFAGQRPAQGV